MRSLLTAICVCVLAAGLVNPSAAQAAEARTTDVVVVGATPAGVAAAVNAARQGVRVLLLEESGNIGGLASGGLSNTDLRSFESQGGTFREFMQRVEQHYADTYGPNSQQVIDCVKGGYYEPGVARLVFEQMLAEQPTAQVERHHRLTGAEVTEATGAQRRRIVAATFDDLKHDRTVTIRARVFIDATYEGDLLAAAGVPYHLGCESKDAYGEPLAFDEENNWVQTYNFRACLTRDPENRLPIEKPESYNRDNFTLLIEAIRRGDIDDWANPSRKAILKVRPIPNNKADFNDQPGCPVSMALKNVNHPWPEGDHKVRERIYQIYKDHTLGLFWFLGNDPEVPEHIRKQMLEWGLPKDEWADTGHWSPALYVREGRRMIGDYVFTEHDTQPTDDTVRAPIQKESVAIGDYSLNCHGVYSPSPGVNVGRIGKSIRPFGIPYKVMLPRETDGLLVPVAISSSHVGFAAIRMEPSWTGLGQAAGLAAANAVQQNIEVRDVNVRRLQRQLHEAGAMTVYISDLAPEIQIPRPAWDPPGSFTARVHDVFNPGPYFVAAQFFGTLGLFHDLVDPTTATQWRSPPATGQWRERFPYHDIEPERVMTDELAAHWLARVRELDPTLRFRGPLPQADGRLTRGGFLNSLYAAVVFE